MSENVNRKSLKELKEMLENDSFYRAFYGESATNSEVSVYDANRAKALSQIDTLLGLDDAEFKNKDQSELLSTVQIMVSQSHRTNVSKRTEQAKQGTLEKRSKILLKEVERFGSVYFKYNSTATGKKAPGAPDAVRYNKDREIYDRLDALRIIVDHDVNNTSLTDGQKELIKKSGLDPELGLDVAYKGLENTYDEILNRDYIRSKSQTEATKLKGSRLRNLILLASGVTLGATATTFLTGLGSMPTNGGGISTWLKYIFANAAVSIPLASTFAIASAAGIVSIALKNSRRNKANERIKSFKNIAARNVYLLTLQNVAKRNSINLDKRLSRKELDNLTALFNNELKTKTYADLYRSVYKQDPHAEHLAEMQKDKFLTADGKLVESKLIGKTFLKGKQREQMKGLIDANRSFGKDLADSKLLKLAASRNKIKDPDLEDLLNTDIYNDITQKFSKKSALAQVLLGKGLNPEPAPKRKSSDTPTINIPSLTTPQRVNSLAFADQQIEENTTPMKRNPDAAKVLQSEFALKEHKIDYKYNMHKYVLSISKAHAALTEKQVATLLNSVNGMIDTLSKKDPRGQFTTKIDDQEITIGIAQTAKESKKPLTGLFGKKK